MNKLYILLLTLFLMNSCAEKITQPQNETSKTMVEFTEERKLNYANDFPEITIVNNVEELTQIYSQIQDPKLMSSAPIPLFDSKTETMVVLKPTLKNLEFADIEIQETIYRDTQLIVKYKEVEDWEFTQNKWKDPMVILRIKGKPTKITLINE